GQDRHNQLVSGADRETGAGELARQLRIEAAPWTDEHPVAAGLRFQKQALALDGCDTEALPDCLSGFVVVDGLVLERQERDTGLRQTLTDTLFGLLRGHKLTCGRECRFQASRA